MTPAALCRVPAAALGTRAGRCYVAAAVLVVPLAEQLPRLAPAADVLNAPGRLALVVFWPLVLALPPGPAEIIATVLQAGAALVAAALLTGLARTLPRLRRGAPAAVPSGDGPQQQKGPASDRR
ncbi:hypothetical protein [Kitasatospora paranensis]|uniref:Uncharacterized protein n=1 Tax=Kitasatospora paranensis TaxID=258053 RepID=A0ABW2G8M1_9ACTN